MTVLPRRSTGTLNRNQLKPGFRRQTFATRLLLAVLATLIALEPAAIAQQGIPLPIDAPAHGSHDWVPSVYPYQKELPYDGALDLYHNIKNTDETHAAMYAFRNSVFMDALLTRSMIKRMLGGSRLAAEKAQLLGHGYNGNLFAVPPEAKRLYVKSETGSGGTKKLVAYPEFADYIAYLDDDQAADSVSQTDREQVIAQLLMGAINTIKLDQEIKFYSSDYWDAHSISDQFDRDFMGTYSYEWRAKHFHDYESDPAINMAYSGEFERQKTDWLKKHDMEDWLASLMVERDQMSAIPLLAQKAQMKPWGFKDNPLYQNLYQVLKSFQFNDANGNPTGTSFPAPDATQQPVSPKLPETGRIAYPTWFDSKIDESVKAAGGFGLPSLLKHNQTRLRIEALIDSALLNTLDDTTRVMTDWFANVDYLDESRSNWAQATLSDHFWTEMNVRYQYLAKYTDTRDGKQKGFIDFDKARKVVTARVNNYNKWSDRVTFTAKVLFNLVSIAAIVGSIVAGPEASAGTFLCLSRVGWLTLSGIVAAGSAVAFWDKWRRTAKAEQLAREGFMIRNTVDPQEYRRWQEAGQARSVARSDFYMALGELVLSGAFTRAFRTVRLSRWMTESRVIIQKSDLPALQLSLFEMESASAFSLRAKQTLAFVRSVFESPKLVRAGQFVGKAGEAFKNLPIVRNALKLCALPSVAVRHTCEEMTVFALTDYPAELAQRWEEYQDGTLNWGDAMMSAGGSTLMTIFLVWTNRAPPAVKELTTEEARLRLKRQWLEVKDGAAAFAKSPFKTAMEMKVASRAAAVAGNSILEFSKLGIKNCLASFAMYGVIGGLGYKTAALKVAGITDPEKYGDEAGNALALGAAACGYSGVYSTLRYRFLKEPIVNFLVPVSSNNQTIRYIVRMVPIAINNFEGGFRFVPYSQGAYFGIPAVAEVPPKEEPVKTLPHQPEIDQQGFFVKNVTTMRPEVRSFPWLDDRPPVVYIEEDKSQVNPHGESTVVPTSDLSNDVTPPIPTLPSVQKAPQKAQIPAPAPPKAPQPVKQTHLQPVKSVKKPSTNGSALTSLWASPKKKKKTN